MRIGSSVNHMYLVIEFRCSKIREGSDEYSCLSPMFITQTYSLLSPMTTNSYKRLICTQPNNNNENLKKAAFN